MESADRWLCLELALAEEAADIGGDVLLELGAPGFEVRDAQTFRACPPSTVALLAYFPEEAGPPERLQQQVQQQLRTRLAAAGLDEPRMLLGVRIQAEEDPGWAEAYKPFFHPIPVGRRLLVRPPWEEVLPGEQRAVLTLDPGLAFGTGNHPSTRLCLEAIEALSPLPSLLDVGCGSGILAIAAALLGAGRVVGIDVDEDAVRIAQDNARRNSVEPRTSFSATPLHEVGERFPLVAANILSGTLIELAAELVQRVEPGGRLLLAGILAGEADAVLQAFAAHEMVLLQRLDGLDDGGEPWSALLLGRSPILG